MDADLGGGIIKQRVARTGQGRSGGYRMLIAYRSRSRAVFLYGFAKANGMISRRTNWKHCEKSAKHGLRRKKSASNMPLKRGF